MERQCFDSMFLAFETEGHIEIFFVGGMCDEYMFPFLK